MRNCVFSSGGFSEPGPCGAGGAAGSSLDDQTGGECAKGHCEDDLQRNTSQSSAQTVRTTDVYVLQEAEVFDRRSEITNMNL